VASTQEPPGKDLQDFQNLPRSPLISYIAKVAEQQQKYHYTLAALEPSAVLQWAAQYLRNRIGPRHRFNVYENPAADNGVYPLRDDSVIGGQSDTKSEVRVSIAGDWGTGTDEAAEVASRMMEFIPHYTIHLGDVYYVGAKSEVEENCLGANPPNNAFTPCTWPAGSVGSFALTGNHEMYALGNAYFDLFLPTLGMRPSVGQKPSGQKASFFCLENEFWRIIGLDTGYNSLGVPVLEYLFSPSCSLRNEELEWLKDQVKIQGDPKERGIVLLTHHQYCSAFDSEYPKTAQQLSKLINRPVLWLWGHEHRMAIYGKFSKPGSLEAYGRCIGHGGMPIAINPVVVRPDRPVLFTDNRRYASPEEIVVGYNGFANLTFKENALSIDYRDLKGSVVFSEAWQVDNGQLKTSG
jgi:hypothetical protein